MSKADQICIDVPAKFRYLNMIGGSIRAILERMDEFDISSETLYNVQLAVHELCNNIIEHAYGDELGQIKLIVTLDWEHAHFIIDLYDDGASFDPAAVGDPDLRDPQVKGYGLFLARQLLDELHYETLAHSDQVHQNHWRLLKVLQPKEKGSHR